MTDLECAKAIASRDEHVTQDFYNKHRTEWKALIAAICRNPELEDDVFSHFGEELIRACTNFQGRAALKTYLTGTLRNLCQDAIRKKARGPETTPIDEAVEQSPAKIRRDPRDYITCKELFKVGFGDLEKSLSPRDWATFIMRLQRVRQEEIARVMKVTPAAISQKIKAICKSLDNILQQLSDGPYSDCIDYFWSVAGDVAASHERPTGGNTESS